MFRALGFRGLRTSATVGFEGFGSFGACGHGSCSGVPRISGRASSKEVRRLEGGLIRRVLYITSLLPNINAKGYEYSFVTSVRGEQFMP